MSLTDKARELEESYGFLPDPHDRFQYLIEQSSAAEGLPTEERVREHRVDGCQSSVWVVAEEREGRLYFRTDGDAPVVKALAWFLADFYSGATREEIVATAPTFIDRLGLQRALTENRRRGLRALVARFQSLAQSTLTT